jgi:hypothetical protein
VSRKFGIDEDKCSDALHQIKQAGSLGGQDAIIIYDDGRVVDALNGDEIGNLYDEN